MSHSILKRCLQLVEEDLPNSSSSKQTKHSIKKKQKKNHTIFDLIPEQKRLTVTQKTGKNAVKQKVLKIKPTEKFTVKQAKEKMKNNKSRVDETVKKLLALDATLQLDDKTKELMLQRAKTGHYVIPKKEEKDEEDVFTAEDFAKFEREYFPK